MASRYWKIGTLYARTCNAIRMGILTPQQRPVWLEAYQKYPPLDTPEYVDEEDNITDITFQPNKLEVTPLVYIEDEYRLAFFLKKNNI